MRFNDSTKLTTDDIVLSKNDLKNLGKMTSEELECIKRLMKID